MVKQTKKDSQMNFYQWLMKNYDGSDCPIGDIAMDIKQDNHYPKSSRSRKHIYDYLESQHACDAVLDIFNKAYKLYAKDLLKKNRRKDNK